MKTIKLLSILALFIGFASCSSNDDDSVSGNDSLEFEGSYSREFDAAGSLERATYTITDTTINYDLSGDFAETNYDIEKEYYSSDDNRWIGYSESKDTYYVIFFRNVSNTEITLYKQEVASLEEGEAESVPDYDEDEDHGWNTYEKGLAISGTVSNLDAVGTDTENLFTKFDFTTGAITTSDTDWDIAFYGTSVIINGGEVSDATTEPERNGDAGAYIATGLLDEITSVDTSLFVQDSIDSYAIVKGSGNGWYTYTGSPLHQILPIAGKVIVLKTRDGKYAKVEILSYYKDLSTDNDSRYYTFNYVYQPNDEVTTF